MGLVLLCGPPGGYPAIVRWYSCFVVLMEPMVAKAYSRRTRTELPSVLKRTNKVMGLTG